MKIKNQKYLFIIYFIIVYTLLNILFLNTIAINLINLWEYIIKHLFGNLFNYQAFIFVPVCSGVISLSIYLGIIIAGKIAYLKKVKIKSVLYTVLLLWLVNLLRLIIVLSAEKLSLTLAKITHIVSWFIVGAIILYLALKSFK
jgi:hypothetical protein